MSLKILVVDDSALIRRELTKLFVKNGFEVDIAKNGQEAIDKALSINFDVITMDINMPVLNGLSAVKEIMKNNPTPIVMVSSLTQSDADITFEALDYGAVDFVAKPGTITLKVKESGEEIVSKVKAASTIKHNRLIIRKAGNTTKAILGSSKRDRVLKRGRLSSSSTTQSQFLNSKEIVRRAVLVGSSTGGPTLIEKIATTVPADYPYPICVVQHMPETFTEKFAQRLNSISNLEVVEATNNMLLTRGKIIIGKGGRHMHFSKKASGHIHIKLVDNLNNAFFVPSVNDMFFSATKIFNCSDLLAIELTGIGDDGADGLVELKKRGAYTIAQSESSATIYGMPRAAYERGGTVKVLDFEDILDEIVNFKGDG
jgi:two-component system chemotaxis response regulator CheB